MGNQDKWLETYEKLFAFGGPQLGIGVFVFPFLPIVFAANHIGYLAFLPLGLYASYAIVDTTEKLKAIFVGSKLFQKRLCWCSLLNLLSIWVHPIFGVIVTLIVAVYFHISAPKYYASLEPQ